MLRSHCVCYLHWCPGVIRRHIFKSPVVLHLFTICATVPSWTCYWFSSISGHVKGSRQVSLSNIFSPRKCVFVFYLALLRVLRSPMIHFLMFLDEWQTWFYFSAESNRPGSGSSWKVKLSVSASLAVCRLTLTAPRWHCRRSNACFKVKYLTISTN